MPELPEVETVRRGLEPHLRNRRIEAVHIRDRRLRWPVPRHLSTKLSGQRIGHLARRGKYLILALEHGYLLIHLGMSATLRVLSAPEPPGRHDHLDIELEGGVRLRFRDPRRFGSVLFTKATPERHRLLRTLGPEPLGEAFTGAHLYRRSRSRRCSVKGFIMDGRTVAGVGNIYANEALYRAGIHPARACGRIGMQRYERLAATVREILREAIALGGSTLRDFLDGDGNPGYFVPRLKVYGRAGLPCQECGRAILRRVIAQRASYYCGQCQR